MTNQAQKVFPVGLMLEGRPCLVVGAGKIATRKVNLLLEAGAVVMVVAPEAIPELESLAAEKRLRYAVRPFEEKDLDDIALVYAATSDRRLNRHILEQARARRILCCAVDDNWPAGDFVTPASVRKHGLVFSVSTGGRACRRSRLLKESLSRHVDALAGSTLFVLGTSHEQMPLATRERLHLAGRRLEDTACMLRQVWGLHEFMLLNTCNRVELHGIGLPEVGILKRLMGFEGLAADAFYLKQGWDAYEHTVALASGLLSQMPGENSIVTQIKQAIEQSVAAGWAAGALREWVSAALHVSKDVRQAVMPHLRAGEIEDLGVEFIEKTVGDIAARRLLVMGSGQVGEGFMGRALERLPFRHVDWCYHRRAPEVRSSWRARVSPHPWSRRDTLLPDADVIVTCMTSDHYLLGPDLAPLFDHRRSVLLLDLATPRNIDPELARDRPQLRLEDLDSLKAWHRQHRVHMPSLLRRCLELTAEHKDLYEKIVHSFQGGD